MKGFLRMKYEQFLMRLFDRVLSLMNRSDRTSWYPRHVLCQDLEDKIDDLERELYLAHCHIKLQDHRISELKLKVGFYEKDEEES